MNAGGGPREAPDTPPQDSLSDASRLEQWVDAQV